MYNALYTTNFLSTLNDNYQKMLGMLVVTTWVAPEYKPMVVSLAGAALVLPYIFCSPLANKAAQKFGKKKVVTFCKLLELPIVMIAITGFLMKDESLFAQQSWFTPVASLLVILSIFIIGIQSSMYSPAKYGLIRDIGGVENVSRGMGGMESISFLGMLLGTAIAAFAVEELPPIGYSSLLLLFALAGYIASLCISAEESPVEHTESLNPFAYMKSTYQLLKQYKGLNEVIIILSVFWWFAATIQLSLVVYCQDDMGLTGGAPGVILCIAALGISFGCVLSGRIGNKHFEIARAPIYGCLVGVLLFIIFALNARNHIVFTVLLFAMTVLAGFFKVPMDAVIQRTVKPDELNAVLAYFNQVSFIFMLGASVTYYLLTLVLPQRYVFLVGGIVMISAAVALVYYYPPIIRYWKTKEKTV